MAVSTATRAGLATGAGLGPAVALLVAWGLGELGHAPPADVELALGTVLGAVLGLGSAARARRRSFDAEA